MKLFTPKKEATGPPVNETYESVKKDLSVLSGMIAELGGRISNIEKAMDTLTQRMEVLRSSIAYRIEEPPMKGKKKK